MRITRRTTGRAAAVLATAAALLLGATPTAFAGTRQVCNAAFCNTTIGSGTKITEVRATKIGANRGVLGFFEIFGPKGVHLTSQTNSADVWIVPVSGTVPKGALLCVRFFAKAGGNDFVEVGTAQCTTSPF
jgi:hypothetical protein